MGDQRIVGDRYRLSSRLGRGGTAEVYFGLDTRLCRPVAVKLLRPELADDAEARALFRREARFVGGLQHPNVVAVYDAGVTTDAGTGASLPYLVLEYVPGQTLRSMLAQGRALEPTRALRITRDLLDALACCHAAGVVHHDVKPANVIIALDGAVKLMDFGIARLLADGPTGAPAVGAVRGTAKYLAPERLRGGSGDARADLYSVGVLLYQLLVGRPPFVGDEATVLRQQLYAGPVPPSALNPALGPDLDAVLRKALAKAPADRFGSAVDMRAAVQGVLERGVGSGAAAAAAAAAAVGAAAPATPVVVGSAGRRRLVGVLGSARRRRALVAAGVAAALVPMAGLVARTGDLGAEQVEASVSTVDGSSTETARSGARASGSAQRDEARSDPRGSEQFRAPAAGSAPSASRPRRAAEVADPRTATERRVAAAAVDPGTGTGAARPVGRTATDVRTSQTPTTAKPEEPTTRPAPAAPASPPKAAPKPSTPPRGGGAPAPRPVVNAPEPVKPVKSSKPVKPVKAQKPAKAQKPKAAKPPRAQERPKAPRVKPSEPPKAKPEKGERGKPSKPGNGERGKPSKPEKGERGNPSKPEKGERGNPSKPEKGERGSGSGKSGSGKPGRGSGSGERDRKPGKG